MSVTTPPDQNSIDRAEVKRLTETVVRVLNSKDFAYQGVDGREMHDHIAGDFEGIFHGYPHAITFEQQTDLWRKMAHEHPLLQFEILDLSTVMRRKGRSASVLLNLAITGFDDEMRMNGMCELWWGSDGGKWLLTRHVVMRGLLMDVARREANDA